MKMAAYDAESKQESMEVTIMDLERLDPCFPQVIDILRSCHLFDDVPGGSIDISVDQLTVMLSAILCIMLYVMLFVMSLR
jgi:hypothetical protein